MKFLVVGLGSIGKRHIKNLLKLKIKKQDIFGFDPREDRIKEARDIGILNFVKNLDNVKKKEFDGAFICSPTSMHIDHSIILAKKQINLFIEKPLDSKLSRISILKKLEKKFNLKILITYPFRFSEHANKLKEVVMSKKLGRVLYFRGVFSEFLPDWHPYESYKSFYMAKKKLGGGSILDQSHILDMAHYLFGNFDKVLSCFNTKVSSLKVQSDDIAEIFLKTKNGIFGSIHQDMFGREHKKNMEIYCEKGNIFWDVYDLSVSVFSANNKKIKKYNFKKDHNRMYIRQTKHIIDLIKSKTKPKISLDDGIHTLKTILLSEKISKNKGYKV
mgnify:CR=1 FL=1|jgi:predicted dehydrogenase|tara:strand:- start:729 stop:1718 length:990 start_codon:yes stop_codon:yes gene_type:complete